MLRMLLNVLMFPKLKLNIKSALKRFTISNSMLKIRIGVLNTRYFQKQELIYILESVINVTSQVSRI